MRHADVADRRTWPSDRERTGDGVVGPDALERRVGADPAGKAAHRLDRIVAPFLDDLARTELAGQGLPGRVPGQSDDPASPEALRREHGRQTHGAVADDRDRVSGRHAGTHRGVVAGAHDVGQGQQRAHRRVVVRARRDFDERPVGLRDADALRLGTIDPVAPEEAPVDARCLHPGEAIRAGAVTERERRDHEVTLAHSRHRRPDGLDDADEFVARAIVIVGRLTAPEPQIGAAHTGKDHADDGVRRCADAGIGNVRDGDVARSVEDRCSHGYSSSISSMVAAKGPAMLNASMPESIVPSLMRPAA